ncbi:MAG: hypothetical protein JSS09_00480 [Verrucomicrobia bacterium]|nr:hypothetical protein [Verrucomicrobiota bacterium]
MKEGSSIKPVEIKSSETINTNLFEGLLKWENLTKNATDTADLIKSWASL